MNLSATGSGDDQRMVPYRCGQRRGDREHSGAGRDDGRRVQAPGCNRRQPAHGQRHRPGIAECAGDLHRVGGALPLGNGTGRWGHPHLEVKGDRFDVDQSGPGGVVGQEVGIIPLGGEGMRERLAGRERAGEGLAGCEAHSGLGRRLRRGGRLPARPADVSQHEPFGSAQDKREIDAVRLPTLQVHRLLGVVSPHHRRPHRDGHHGGVEAAFGDGDGDGGGKAGGRIPVLRGQRAR